MNVFVYGTLLCGESNHHVAQPYLISVQIGGVRGVLYDVGEYPALMLDAEANIVAGEWLALDPSALPVLDELEDYNGPEGPNEYERVWVRDESGPALEGWIYVYNDARGLPVISDGSWRDYCRSRNAKIT